MLLLLRGEGVLWLELPSTQVRARSKSSWQDMLLVLCTLCQGRGDGGALGYLWLLWMETMAFAFLEPGVAWEGWRRLVDVLLLTGRFPFPCKPVCDKQGLGALIHAKPRAEPCSPSSAWCKFTCLSPYLTSQLCWLFGTLSPFFLGPD